MSRTPRPATPVTFLVDLGPSVPGSTKHDLHAPLVDVVEYALGWRLVFDLSGADPETLVIEARGRAVVVRGSRRATDSLGGRFVRLERAAGAFERAVELSEDVDPEAARATYTDGLLTVDVPKKAHPRGRTIPIRGGSSG